MKKIIHAYIYNDFSIKILLTGLFKKTYEEGNSNNKENNLPLFSFI